MRIPFRQDPIRARGAVLFVALIVLILLTLLGITAAQVTVLQERMSGSFRAQQLAFERAEGRMAAGRDLAVNPLLVYDTVSDTPIELASGNVYPWNAWLSSFNEYPPAASSLPTTPLEMSVRACGGACPQRKGAAVGEDPQRKPRFFVISAQQKDLASTDPQAAAWATVQTVYVY